MSEYEVRIAAELATQVATEIGKKLIIRYGLRRFWTKKLDIKLHFTIAVNFYSITDCQRVYEILFFEIRKYIPKDDNIPKHILKLNFGSDINYEYYLAIISAQDDILLGMLDLETLYYSDMLTESLGIPVEMEAPLTASAVRLFLWPSNLPNKISLGEFKNVLNEVYDFYKEFSEQLLNYMKNNKLHDLETKLFVELGLDSQTTNILQNMVKSLPDKMKKNFHLNAQKKSLEVLLDDGSVIDAIMRILGG